MTVMAVMKSAHPPRLLPSVLDAFLVAALLVPGSARAQEAAPAVQGGPRRVCFDEGHHNVHTTRRGYDGLAALLRDSGFQVEARGAAFTAAVLGGCTVLIVASPRGAGREAPMEERGRPAFTGAEVAAVEAWVASGGGLLLVTDHPPIGAAAAALAERFGVRGRDAFTEDPTQGRHAHGAKVPWAVDGRDILFHRADDSLGDHPILRGGGGGEEVRQVATFLGQSLSGPAHAVSLLRLGAASIDRRRRWAEDHWRPAGDDDHLARADGRSQGLALAHGEGRVVVVGEAGLWAHRGLGPDAAAPDGSRLDNDRLAVNAVRWLAGEM